MSRFGLAVLLLLGIASLSSVSAWTTSDSLPFLYNAAAAYCDPNTISGWSCGFCTHNKGVRFVSFVEHKATSVFGYVSIFNNEVVVAYRGSECFMNWIDNLNAFRTPYPAVSGAEVHKGFYSAYKDVMVQTRSAVASALKSCPGCHTIRCTGHSLGGALASHAAADLSFIYAPHSSAPSIKLTTFGCPRVGNDKFASWLQTRVTQSYRMTHNADPVVHLPPKMMGYHHVATEIFETKSGYKQCNGSGEDPHCADGVILPLNIADHLTYMGVNIAAGMKDRCQAHGANCKRFYAKYLEMDWEAEFPGITNEAALDN